MGDAVIKVQKNKNITLPVWLLRKLHISIGDFIRLQETKRGVLIKPAKLVDPSQAYFWTKAWQEGEREAAADIRKGRIKGFKSVRALMEDLRA